MKFYWDSKELSTRRHPVNIRFSKKLVQPRIYYRSGCGTLERYGHVIIEIKHMYPCFMYMIDHEEPLSMYFGDDWLIYI